MATAGQSGPTVVRTNDPKTVKLYSVSLHVDSVRKSAFLDMMSEGTHNQSMAEAERQSNQTSTSYPIVIITDLQSTAGDKVTMDLNHIISGKPTMGDNVIEGKSKGLSFSTMELSIDQTRFAVNPGARMTQKRTEHNLRMLARANLVNYFARLNDEKIMVHLAGARGDQNDADWNLPLDTDPDFNTIMVNPVEPPTTNRYYVVGGGDDVSDLGSTDVLTLETLDYISADLREQPFPPHPIEVMNDPLSQSSPVWCLMVTQRQWHYILIRAATNGHNWRNFVADAAQRGKLSNHPLFSGVTGLWNGMLIKRMDRAIRFNPGSTVKLTNSTTGNETSATVASDIHVDRALLIGGQALALAYGDAGNGALGSYPTNWSEKEMDHGNSIEIAAGQMAGTRKIKFTQSDGRITDFGVIAIDSYAPAVDSALGRALRSSLQS